MLNEASEADSQRDPLGQDAESEGVGPENATGHPGAQYDESLVEELGALIDDAGVYLTAEVAFQKTRAKLAGKNIGAAVAFVIVALILLHIAIIALAVGLVIALEPLVTIWGAIGIVVGLMLLGVGLLIYAAARRGKVLSALFSSDKEVPRP
ncbi:MAG: phage holin family protein [Pseudomonadota bacterium]